MKTGTKAADLIYPPRCFACGKLLLRNEETVCGECVKKGKARAGLHSVEASFVTRGTAPFIYREEIREVVRAFKFKRAMWLFRPAADFMLRAFREAELEADVITYVPMRPWEKEKRGYNQSRILAQLLARRTGIPFVRALKKVKRTRTQSKLRESERRANVFGAYACRLKEKIGGKTVLLVDDVVTTGSTVSENARVLLMAGAKAVNVLVLAKTVMDE